MIKDVGGLIRLQQEKNETKFEDRGVLRNLTFDSYYSHSEVRALKSELHFRKLS